MMEIERVLNGKFGLKLSYQLIFCNFHCRYMGIGLSTQGVSMNRLPGQFCFLSFDLLLQHQVKINSA